MNFKIGLIVLKETLLCNQSLMDYQNYQKKHYSQFFLQLSNKQKNHSYKKLTFKDKGAILYFSSKKSQKYINKIIAQVHEKPFINATQCMGNNPNPSNYNKKWTKQNPKYKGKTLYSSTITGLGRMHSVVADLEKQKVIKNELKNLQSRIVSKKNTYNKIHDKSLRRKAKLKELIREYQISTSKETLEDASKQLEIREMELHDLVGGYKNEKIICKTLIHMYEWRKKSMIYTNIPLTKVKSSIIKCQKMMREQDISYTQTQSKKLEYLKWAQEYENRIQQIAQQKKAARQSHLKDVESTYRLQQCIDQERKRNEELEIQRNSAFKMLKLERQIGQIMKLQELNEEIQRMTETYRLTAEKYDQLHEKTNLASVSDLFQYFVFLKEKQQNLEAAIEQNKQKVQELVQTRNTLIVDLNQLQSNIEDMVKNTRSYEQLESRLIQRIQDLDLKDQNLHRLNVMIASAQTSISRLFYQLTDDNEKQRKPDEIEEIINTCAYRLQIMVESILQQGIYFTDESINTGAKFYHPPNFMRLNTEFIFGREELSWRAQADTDTTNPRNSQNSSIDIDFLRSIVNNAVQHNTSYTFPILNSFLSIGNSKLLSSLPNSTDSFRPFALYLSSLGKSVEFLSSNCGLSYL